MVEMPSFRLNITDDYNTSMNDIDLVDQVRNVYHWGLFILKRKWWRLMMMWCPQILQANLFVLYKKYMVIHDQKLMSHFVFNKKYAFRE